MIAEPQLAHFPNPISRYLAATRPPFLSVTLVACLIGLSTAHLAGLAIHPLKAALTVFFALVAHAGANVINDYFDALSGADAANQERQFPFTGGSRFIQNGVMSVEDTGRFGRLLLLSTIPPGLWLAAHSDPGLLLIGMAGLLVGWAYSAPPLKLMCRGVGELAIVAGWLLVCIGADFVQRGAFSSLPVLAGLPFALLVACILYVNQFPDLRGDAAAGKRTLVVRLGAERARWGYPLIAGFAHLWLLAMVAAGQLPPPALLALLPGFLFIGASRTLMAEAARPANLAPAIKQTILATNLHGLIFALALLIPWSLT